MLDEAQRNASDYRLWLLFEVEEQLSKWDSTSKVSADSIDLLVSLYEQERLLDSHSADMLAHVALHHNGLGRDTRAVKFALQALEQGLIQHGPQGTGVQEMVRLLENPRAHWSWRKRVEAGTKKSTKS
jgi:hypothetical protein